MPSAKELTIEDRLRVSIQARGGMCIKLWALVYAGIPDRLVLMPSGRVWFVELKRPEGGRYSRLQLWWRAKLDAMGFKILELHTKETVDDFVRSTR